jgi:hypothetical protein
MVLVLVGTAAEAKPRKAKPASPSKAASARAKIAAPKPARSVDATSAKRLGDAYRAYDANEPAEAKKLLAKLDDAKLVNTDYALWLRGMVALRGGEAAEAKRAFEKLAKISGTRFAREVPWRLADCAWELGERAAAARQYGRLITAEKAGNVGDVGTARFRIAEAAATASAYRAFAFKLSTKEYISFSTMSVTSPRPRTNSGVGSTIGVRMFR